MATDAQAILIAIREFCSVLPIAEECQELLGTSGKTSRQYDEALEKVRDLAKKAHIAAKLLEDFAKKVQKVEIATIQVLEVFETYLIETGGRWPQASDI